MLGLDETLDMDKTCIANFADGTEQRAMPFQEGSEIAFTEKIENMHQGMEGVALEPEIRYDIPNCEVAMVTGDPFGNACKMDFEQGDNPYNASGNCGLVSISNMLRRAGMDVSEKDVTRCAIDSGLCDYNPMGSADNNGGTTIEMRCDILNKFGVASDICPSGNGGTLEDIADAIDSGRGVLISVNAGELWDCDDGSVPFWGRPVSNHCIMVTGIARNAATGEIAGVYIADSGRGIAGDACRYLTVEKFDEAYTNVYGSGANITRNPVMMA